ncbi:hypothetical protein ABZX69_25980 [Streptomyces sp. NPDC004074]
MSVSTALERLPLRELPVYARQFVQVITEVVGDLAYEGGSR